jgi:glycosyltransferase involved in cell wall biosynthesis
MESTAPLIGLLVKQFPKISETFILGEVLGLERKGITLQIFSINHPTDEIIHSTATEVQSPLYYLPVLWGRELLAHVKAHVATAMRQPFRYIETLRYALQRHESEGLFQFTLAICLARNLRKLGITHLHVHFVSTPVGIAELVKYLTGITFSISAHAKDIYLSSPTALRRKLRAAKFTVTCTEYNRDYLASLAEPDTPIFRMYHGIDGNRFQPSLADTIPNTESSPLILSIGRLRPKKGFPVLIQACKQLAEQGVPFRCEIVGYGPDQELLQALIDRSGLDKIVTLVGKLTQDQVIERYRAATLFVLPCIIADDGDRDGIPNVLLEAMAMGLPVVSTSVSGVPEIIEDDNTGLLIPPGDAAALSKTLHRLLTDSFLCGRLGTAGRTLVLRSFSNEINLSLLAELLHDTTHQGPTPTPPYINAPRHKTKPRLTLERTAYALPTENLSHTNCLCNN